MAARNWTAHLFYADGGQQGGFPQEAGGWYIYPSVILGMLQDNSSADIIVGARGQTAWAWNNFSWNVEGWPKPLDENVYLTAAMGDVDMDGTTELVS